MVTELTASLLDTDMTEICMHRHQKRVKYSLQDYFNNFQVRTAVNKRINLVRIGQKP